MTKSKERIKLAVVCGGPSSEREVSLKSGQQVAKNLPRDKYEVKKIEITKDGRWLIGKRSLTIFDKRHGTKKSDLKKFDVVFIAMHGKFGEDGKIQALLEILDVPYTGSGVIASALGLNKAKANHLLRQFMLLPETISQFKPFPQKDTFLFHKMFKKKLGVPYVVKPNDSGSSVGTTMVGEARQLLQAIKKAFRESSEVLIQECIDGRELTCGVLGNSGQTNLITLPPVEIITDRQFFDYEAKYSPKTREVCPARISPKITAEIQRLAKLAHVELGCDGLTRSDFILAPNSKLYFLEINTIPGLTEASLCPKEAKAAGMSFGDFLDKQVQLALSKKSRTP